MEWEEPTGLNAENTWSQKFKKKACILVSLVKGLGLYQKENLERERRLTRRMLRVINRVQNMHMGFGAL